MLDLVLRTRRLVTGHGEAPRAVGVRDGVVVAVEPYDADLPAREEVVLEPGQALLPGLVDTHVHVNEPGRTEWEGFVSATRAAAAGGVTTFVDMPLNSVPPTTTLAALEEKRLCAKGSVHVDVGFWGGVVPDNVATPHELRALHDAGVFGFKCFLLHSGVDEFPHVDAAQLERAMTYMADFDALIIVHAEDSTAIDRAPSAHGELYRDFLRSRPRGAENVAVAQVIEAARYTGARAHVLHLSSSDALPMLASARADGVQVTAETCPHYLSFTAEAIPDGATQFKCCPPIRESANRELLWQGLRDGVIDAVVSDHSPCTPDLKRLDIGDFGVAWGGVASLQLGLSAVWSGARPRGFTLSDVVRWMSEQPARLARLQRKGRVAVGYDADLVVLAPDEAHVVDVARLHHRNPVSPYDGLPLAGVVHRTYLRGRVVHDVTTGVGDEPLGELLSRGTA